MPRRFERHKTKSSWGSWNTEPARSDQVRAAAADDPQPALRGRARKDTRSWCRGKVGVAHKPVIEMDACSPHFTREGCRWDALWFADLREQRVGWMCGHREVCSACRKVLRVRPELRRKECPGYPGSEEQRAQAQRELEESEARVSRWYARRRRPVITGPQGYRRRRGGADA